MAISMIIGKPGSGKSYYAVSRIADMVRDWCAYELREGKEFPRKLYTNLYLNVEEFQKFIKKYVGDVDVSKYLVHVGDDFFFQVSDSGVRSPYKWWDEVPNKAFLVIDEVHQYMPQGGTGGRDYMQLFTEYVSMHRHREHDLILITQHTDTIHKNILCMASDIFHVVNVKNKVLPVLRIPFADLDVVKEAFGCQRQVATVLYGNYVGRAVKVQSEFNIILKPEIFALYKSHTLGGEGDRPSLKLSPIGSLFWFGRRHWFHLSIKAGLLYAGYLGLVFMFTKFPTVLASTVGGVGDKAVSEGMPEAVESPAPLVSEVSSVEKLQAVPAAVSPGHVEEKKDVRDESQLFKYERERDFYNFTGVYIYGPDFIVLREKGRVNVGEFFEFEGRSVRLDSVDFKRKKFVTSDASVVRMPSDFAPAVQSGGSGSGEVSPQCRVEAGAVSHVGEN